MTILKRALSNTRQPKRPAIVEPDQRVTARGVQPRADIGHRLHLVAVEYDAVADTGREIRDHLMAGAFAHHELIGPARRRSTRLVEVGPEHFPPQWLLIVHVPWPGYRCQSRLSGHEMVSAA